VSLLGAVVDRVAATRGAPVPMQPRGMHSFQGRPSGALRELGAQSAVSTVYSVVAAIAEDVAQVAWYLARLPGPGSIVAPGGVGVIPDVITHRHPASDLWNDPNPWFTRGALMEIVQSHAELAGTGFLIVDRGPSNEGVPLALWPVFPDRMEPVPDRDKFLVGWIYTGPNGERVPLTTGQVIPIRGTPDAQDFYGGMSPVRPLMSDIESVRYSADYNRNFFLNSAEPGGIIEVPNTLQDKDFDRLQRQWNEQHRGVSNAHRVAILEGGAKWNPRQLTFKDMQFMEMRALSSEIIREAWRISKTRLGQTESVNRATAETAVYVNSRHLTKPRCVRWQEALNYRLLPMFGQFGADVEYIFDLQVPKDSQADDAERTSKANAVSLMVNAGFDPAASLEVFGLPPMEWVGIPEGATKGAPQTSTNGGAA
jgi:HK97 family phage portal protein